MDNKEPLLKDEEDSILMRDTEVMPTPVVPKEETPEVALPVEEEKPVDEGESKDEGETPTETSVETETTVETEAAVSDDAAVATPEVGEKDQVEKKEATLVKIANDEPINIKIVSEERPKGRILPIIVTLILTAVVVYLLVRTCLGFYYGFKYQDYTEPTTQQTEQP